MDNPVISDPKRPLSTLSSSALSVLLKILNPALLPTMTTPTTIPPLSSLTDSETLTPFLSTLFEPSPPLSTLLIPSLLLRLTSSPTNPPISSYNYLVDLCSEVANGWTWGQKAEFISGHPMIGEVTNLSALSGKEQGGATRKVVLDRLAHLNALYNTIYPGLRYITFVNSRPRAAIVPEMEGVIGIPISPEPLSDDFEVDEPALESDEVRGRVKSPESAEWKGECTRGLEDVWRIAKARLRGMGVE